MSPRGYHRAVRSGAHEEGDAARIEPTQLEPIEQLRAHEYVAEQLRRQIGLHIIPVGGTLPAERELSAAFAVGRNTVQAAIRLLEAERLVETRRGRYGGTLVIGHLADEVAKDYILVRLRRDRDRVIEALAFRRNIEVFAVSLAARARTANELRLIDEVNERTTAAETDPEFMTHDTEFHLAIARAAHNTFVYEAAERMRLVLNDAITVLPESPAWQRRTVTEHAAIVAALRKRGAEAAAAAMERHTTSTERSIKALLAAL